MKKILLIIVTCVFCTTCGVKDDPEYKSHNNWNKTRYII